MALRSLKGELTQDLAEWKPMREVTEEMIFFL